MIRQGLARTTINSNIARIRRMFKWAAQEELVPGTVFAALRAVDGLKVGRSRARESAPVRPVPLEHVRAIEHLLPEPVRAMVWLQWWSGMRPGEVVLMRMRDIDRTGEVWTYRPHRHKMQHAGFEREIPLGPKAQAVLTRRPWLRSDPDAYLFSPREAIQALRLERRSARKTPLTPSQKKRRPKRNPQRAPGDHYTVGSYRNAIHRAIERYNEDRADEDRVPSWNPGQLRHSAGCPRFGGFPAPARPCKHRNDTDLR